MTEESKPTGTCRVCWREGITLTKNGRIRSHGPVDDRCAGGSDLPLEAGALPLPSRLPEESDEEFHARIAQWAQQHPDHDPRPTAQDLADAREVLAAPNVPDDVWNQATYADQAAGLYGVRSGNAETAPPEAQSTDGRPNWKGIDPWHQPDGPAPDPFAAVDTDDVLLRAARMSPTVAAMQHKYRPDLDGDTVAGTDRTFRNNLDRTGPQAARPHEAAQDADAAAFLGARRSGSGVRSSDQDRDADAAAFLSGGGKPDQDGPGPYFLSSYDGTCGPCGSWFPEGSRIRATGDGEYQGEECCGLDEDTGAQDVQEAVARPAAPKPVRPRRVADPAPMNGNNQYRLPHPATGKLTAFSRMTKFVKLASDHRALFDWELRCALVGIVRDGGRIGASVQALMDQAVQAGAHPATVVKTERVALNALASRAKDAAGTTEQGKSSIGIQVHKFTENVDAGMITVDQVPVEHRAAVRRYRDLVEASGYEVVPDLIEFTTALPDYKVAGRGDQIWRRVEDGVYLIVDKKTGELTWDKHEIAAQLAGYAHGFNENGVCVWNGEGDKTDAANWHWVHPVDADGNRIAVSETEAVVVHMPQDGRGDTLLSVPLEEGWKVFQVCQQNREVHRMKVDFPPIAVPDAVDSPSAAVVGRLARQAEEMPPLQAEPGQVFTAGGPGIAATAAPSPVVPHVPPSEARTPHPWEVLFGKVRTKEDANQLWREAKADPEVTPDRLAALTASAKQALEDREKWAEWEQEFRAVQDRDDANAAYRAAKEDPWMTPERLADLLRIGKETLAKH